MVGDIFSGLTNVSGGDLVFAGNIVNLNGAIINVVSGNLTLASIEQGLVDLRNSNNIANSNFSRTVKNNLNITNNSFITNTHLSNQSTNFIGKNISIFDSIASQFSSSPFSAGRVRVEADLDFTIDRFQNASVPPGFRRNIYGILSLNLADGQGSDISVDARKTIIDNGGVIFTGSFSNGNAGDISIISDVFTIDNSLTNLQSLTDNGSAITSATQGGTGNSGTIDVLASQISLRNGSQLSTGTLGLGNAEDLTIQADSIILDGFNSKNLLPTTISSNSASDGNTGNLSIFSKQLSVTNGANIGAITFDSGNAQSLFIESDTILVSGSRPDPVSGKSSIFASGARINDSAAFSVFEGVPLELTGDSGNVEIIAESLTLNNQGTISAENVGPGLGGFVDIEAESILLNSSQITSGARGNDGGSIQIASRSFKIDNSLLEAISTGDGSGGNISIYSGLLLINSSSVSTSANGTGTGGNIAVNSVYASLRNASNIQANAVNDRAGNVILNSNSAFVDRSSDITATSEVGTSSDGEVIVNQSQGEIQISKIRPVVKNEISTISSQCDSSLNNGKAIQHGLGINGSLALTERQQKALYLKQRIDYASQFYYIDSETGEKVPYQPLLAIEEGEDGNLALIFSPEQSQGLKNLLSSLDDVCSVKT